MRLANVIPLILLALPVQAGPLAEALETAWARHPQSAVAAFQSQAAEALGELAAASTPGPAVLALAHRNDQAGRNQGQREWEVELSAPLWLPGQSAARAAEAAAAQAGAAADNQELRLQLAGELRQAWWNLALARAQQELAAARAASARALANAVERRYQAGELARTDANLARNEVLLAEAERVEAAAGAVRAEQAWRNLTGTSAPQTLAAENAAMAGEHPRLNALQAAARLAQARLKVAQANRREAPQLALSWVRERDDASTPFANSFGVKFSYPFASEPRLRHDLAAARAEVLRNTAELALELQRLEQEADLARRSLERAAQQLDLTRQRQTLLADNLVLAEKSFALGETDLAHLLRARAAAQEAGAALLRQGLERDAAVSHLLQTLGVMP